jgi:hypothetical protein
MTRAWWRKISVLRGAPNVVVRRWHILVRLLAVVLALWWQQRGRDCQGIVFLA